jgi:hypothetical protein
MMAIPTMRPQRSRSGRLVAAIATTLMGIAVNILIGKLGGKVPDWLPIIFSLVALALWLYWAWTEERVRKRVDPLVHRYPIMSLVIFVNIGACIGAGIGVLLWWVSSNPQQHIHNEPGPLARTEFLLESKNPLKEVFVIINLNRRLSPEVLKHFRVMVTIANLDAQYPEATNKNNPHPTLCMGGRDSYPVASFGGKEQKWYGVKDLVWVSNPDAIIQDTAFSMGQADTSEIKLGGGLYKKGPFSTIAELDNQTVNVYVTEPLLHFLSSIEFVGDDYVLLSESADNLAQVIGSPLNDWPEALTPDEQNVKWIMLMPKGTDYERFQREKQQLGHDPDWFPSNYYRPWSMRFDDYTPTRLTKRQE